MKKSILLFVATLLFTAHTFSQIASGTYTIPGSYASFTAAVADLNANGLVGDGPVTFNVADGTYNEQISITSITNASFSDSVIFQSTSSDSSLVTLKFSAGSANNYTVDLNGADYVTFKNMTIQATHTSYGRAISLRGVSNNINFFNCEIVGSANSTSANLAVIYALGQTDSLLFLNNKMKNGAYGIYINGNGYDNKGLRIRGNEITNNYYMGAYILYADAPVISENTITTASTYSNYYGINATYCDNAMHIEKNKISGARGRYGINVTQCIGTALNRALIANNFVQIGLSTYTVYAMYVASSNYQEIYHNSVNATGTGTSGRALYTSGGNNLRVKNNIFANTSSGGGYSMYIQTTSAIDESDYNYLYVASPCGNGTLGYWNGNRSDLLAWQTASSRDANSLSGRDPGFVSSTDLHTNSAIIDDAGTDLSTDVSNDIDGTARPVTPCIGADEYTSTEPAPPACLSGTYTIGSGGDFENFTGAADTLVRGGTCGNVTFNVLPGTYNEQILLASLFTSLPNDSILFQSSTGDSSDVILTYSAGSANNYTVQIKDIERVTFQNMTIQATNTSYGRAIVLSCNANDISFFNCEIIGSANSTSTNLATVFTTGKTNNLSFMRNKIKNGAYGMYINGNGYYNTSLQIKNNEITNNYYGGAYIRYANAPVISENTVTTTSTYTNYSGIYTYYCNNAMRIEKNKISGARGRYGINVTQCIGTAVNRGLIANNFVQVGVSTSSVYAMYVASSNYQDIYHNSVNATGTSSSGRAFYTSGGSNLRVKNNIFANTSTGGGYAIYVQSATAIAVSDYNYFYTSSSSCSNATLGYWAGNRADLKAWQAASVQDANSLSGKNPGFVSSTDLHTNSLQIDNAGTDLSADVSDDIDGESRPTTPCIGADEYTSTEPPAPACLSGTYTIGSGGDFSTFTGAIDTLTQGGVCDNVTFNILPGTYNEQILLTSLPIYESSHSILFQSSTGDSSDVILTHDAGSANNYTVKIMGLDRVTFQNMTIEATNTTYGRVIVLNCNSDNISFFNCEIKNSITTTTSTNMATILTSGKTDNLSIMRNKIQNGAYGIYIEGNGYYNKSLQIKNNEITNNYYMGAYIRYANAPVISENTITTNSTYSNYSGIYAYYCNNAMRIEKNKISGAVGRYGINVNQSIGTAVKRGLIANNFVQIGGTSTKYGIYVASSDFLDIYHNSVNATGTGSNGRAFYTSGGNILKIKNNIFANTSTGGGYAMYIQTTSAIVESDNNDLYTTASNLGYWGGNRSDLTAWQSASLMDANSISVDPVFVSDTNLHTCLDTLNDAGAALGTITDDIDGESRDAVTPDIGADEFGSMLTVDLGNDTISCDSVTLDAGEYPGASYLWSNGDNTQTTIANSSGSYSVTVTGACGEIDSDAIIVTVGVCVGIDETQDSSPRFQVYPNPSSGDFTIKMHNAQLNMQNAQVIVYDALGRTIYEQKLTQQTETISISSKGVYYMQVITDEGRWSEKIIRQ